MHVLRTWHLGVTWSIALVLSGALMMAACGSGDSSTASRASAAIPSSPATINGGGGPTTTARPLTTSSATGEPAGNGTIAPGFAVQVPAGTFYATNTWWRKPDARGVVRAITAGADGNGGKTLPSPEQGELIGWDLPPKGARMASLGTFRPDGPAHGALRVTGATGDILTLQATDGTVYYFDAAKLEFVNQP